MAKRESLRLFSRHLLCQILLTRAQRTCLGESHRKGPAKNVLCSNGNTKSTKNVFLTFKLLPFEHKTILDGLFLNYSPKHVH